MSPSSEPGRLTEPWGDVVARGRTSMSVRLTRLRTKSWHIGQCAAAAGVAWLVAGQVFGHETPFFAPIAAVVSLGTSYGQRLRRVAEVTVGVAVGVFMGDLVTHVLGSGAWQIGLIVAVAMSLALLLDAGAILVTQAAVQSIVVSTLLPAPGAAFLRWTDALIGGGVAVVAASVVPRAPLRRPREQAGVVVRKLGELLRAAADSLVDGDVERALDVLRDARATDSLIAELRAASDEGLSVLASSPFRRRHKGRVRRMAELVEPLDFAMRNTRVLVRRVAVAAYRREPVPTSYPAVMRDLADLADLVAAELEAGRMAEDAIEPLIALARSTTTLERTADLSGEVILAQLRSLIADLLAICGMDPLEATDAIPPLS
ncbi:MAG TPA: FUSC family protein, partial [Nocardioides sp.]